MYAAVFEKTETLYLMRSSDIRSMLELSLLAVVDRVVVVDAVSLLGISQQNSFAEANRPFIGMFLLWKT